MSDFTITGLGEVLWDLFPAGRRLGGAPANFAYHAHALRADGHLVSRVGDDEAGIEIRRRLASLGIHTDSVSIDDEFPTGAVDVQLDAAGKPSYNIREGVAWDHIPCTESMKQLARTSDAVCFGTLASRCPASRRSIATFLENMRPDALRVLDVNLRQHYYSEELLRDLLGHANVLKLSDEELQVLAGLFGVPAGEPEFLSKVCRMFDLRAAALTKGGEGSMIHARDELSSVPAEKGEIADTVGAGDSFTAALVLGLLQQWPLDRVNTMANRVAAFVCSRSGATPDIPERLQREFAG